MRNARKKLSILAMVAASVWQCTQSADPQPDYTFQPAIGKALLFEVTEERYAVNADKQLETKQIKQVPVKEMQDGLATGFIVEQYERANSAQPWKLAKLLTWQKNPTEWVELNPTPKVRLMFPIAEGNTWNANRYAPTTTEQTVKVQDFGKAFGQYPATLTVVYRNDSSLIDVKREREVYAPKLGLVFREVVDINYCQSTPSCIGKGIIAYGSKQQWKRLE